VDVERKIGDDTAKRSVFVAPVFIGIFWLTSGTAGAVAALVGTAIVVGNFLLAGRILSVAARISPAAYHAAALFGFVLRLGLLTIALLVLTWLFELDRTAFAITTVGMYLVLLSWETVMVSRGSEGELEWSK
jgi:hypothetical protein